MTASEDPRRGWLLVRALGGIGDATYCRLIDAFGTPEAVLRASPAELGRHGVRAEALEGLGRGPDNAMRKSVEQELRTLDRLKIRLITWRDAAYPSRLRTIHDPPPMLYCSGALQAADQAAVAVVGSRRASVPGRLFAERLSRELAALGLTIVSGLARGIDAAAHRGAIAANGRTIAVLGCGLDRTYPSEHGALRAQIEAHGAVLSDLPPGAPPHAYHFPRRNRIISGLSIGVVVAEAARESGSLITARLAAEQGREVFAVPSAPAPSGSGTNGLIKQGAKLTETVEDILEELWPHLSEEVQRRAREAQPPTGEPRPALAREEAQLLNVLSADPLHMDEAIARAALPPATVSGVLLALEIKGLVRQLPGHFFVRI